MSISNLKMSKDSLISVEICQLLNAENNGSILKLNYFITNECTLNWLNIAELYLIENDMDFSFENCSRVVNLYRPVWLEASLEITRLSDDDLKQYLELKCKWTNRCDDLKMILFQNRSTATKTIVNILFLTTVIEKSIRTIFSMKSDKTPPHLLRDLLATKEIKDVFGLLPIFFLQILMGTPNSVNLRNIVWHGFPRIDEIPFYYADILIVIIASFGEILNEKQMILNPIHCSQRFRTDELIKEISQNNSFIYDDSATRVFFEVIQNSSFISKAHMIYWAQIKNNFYHNNGSECIILLLPQFELLLRRIYGKLNGIDITAKLYQYYIVMDTFMEESFADGRINTIYKQIDSQTLQMIYDLFIAVRGPRIRDKLSHGDICFRDFDCLEVCRIIIFLSAKIITSVENELNKTAILFKYESRFHPNGHFKISYKIATVKLTELKCLEIPDELSYNVNWSNADLMFESNFKSYSKYRINETSNLKIFFRPKKESEIVLILIKLVTNVMECCDNLKTAFTERIEMFLARSLRSKRRITLKNMLNTMPEICIGLEYLLKLSELIFGILQNDELTTWLCTVIDRLIKNLHHLQKYSENMVKYCTSANNEWVKAYKVTKESFDYYGKIFKLVKLS